MEIKEKKAYKVGYLRGMLAFIDYFEKEADVLKERAAYTQESVTDIFLKAKDGKIPESSLSSKEGFYNTHENETLKNDPDYHTGFNCAVIDVVDYYTTSTDFLKRSGLYYNDGIEKFLRALLQKREELREKGDCDLAYNMRTRQFDP